MRDNTLIFEFKEDNPELREQLKWAGFTIAEDEHGSCFVAQKDVQEVRSWIPLDFDSLFELLKVGRVCGVYMRFRDMLLPRRNISYNHEAGHQWRCGRDPVFYKDELFEVDCDPRKKVVLVSFGGHDTVLRQPEIEKFLDFCQHINRLHDASVAITTLIKAFRTTPVNRGFVGRAIEDAYLKLGRTP